MLQSLPVNFIEESKGLFSMNNKKYISEIENYQEKIKEFFKSVVTEEFYNIWGDTFDIEVIGRNRVVVMYHGPWEYKKFKKECKSVLKRCIRWGAGKKMKIKLSPKRQQEIQNQKTKKNIRAMKFFITGTIFLGIATAAVIVMCNYISNRNFKETFYITSSIKVDSPIRVIQLSDLHGCQYGEKNEKLLERVEALEPDIIICTGDMVNSAKDDMDYAVNLAQELVKIAPSYYVYGNNEVETIYDVPLNEKELDEKFGFDKNNRDETALLKLEDPFEEELEKTGVKVLKNEKDTIKVKSMTVDVYGVLNSNPSSFWSYSEKSFLSYLYENTDNIKITAVHEPYIFETFSSEYWGDLMVCGHTHGGVLRVPLLGPLYTHEGGLFPERSAHFVYGRYDASGSPLIVSSGLENEEIFRINNEPELVIIDINKF